MLRIAYHQDELLLMEAFGTVAPSDAESVLPQLEGALEDSRLTRVLMRLHDARFDAGVIMRWLTMLGRHRRNIGSVAVVGERTVEKLICELIEPICEGEVRFFPEDEARAARQWLLSDRPALRSQLAELHPARLADRKSA